MKRIKAESLGTFLPSLAVLKDASIMNYCWGFSAKKTRAWLRAICGFFLLFTLFPVSASPQEEIHPWVTATDKKIMEAFTKSGGEGMLALFKGNPNVRISPLEMSYRVREGDKFEAVYLLANHTDESLTYTIVCLIDYQQQIFTANDQTSNIHKVSLLPGEQKIFNLTIAPLTQGTHDFVLLAVRDGVKKKVDFSLLSNRANLFIGSGGFSSVEYSKVKTAPLSSNPADTVIFNQTISPEDFSSVLPDFERGAEYFLHIGNAHVQSTNYAVIIFADFEQPSPSVVLHS